MSLSSTQLFSDWLVVLLCFIKCSLLPLDCRHHHHGRTLGRHDTRHPDKPCRNQCPNRNYSLGKWSWKQVQQRICGQVFIPHRARPRPAPECDGVHVRQLRWWRLEGGHNRGEKPGYHGDVYLPKRWSGDNQISYIGCLYVKLCNRRVLLRRHVVKNMFWQADWYFICILCFYDVNKCIYTHKTWILYVCLRFSKPAKVPGSWHFGYRANLDELKTWRSPFLFIYFYF